MCFSKNVYWVPSVRYVNYGGIYEAKNGGMCANIFNPLLFPLGFLTSDLIMDVDMCFSKNVYWRPSIGCKNYDRISEAKNSGTCAIQDPNIFNLLPIPLEFDTPDYLWCAEELENSQYQGRPSITCLDHWSKFSACRCNCLYFQVKLQVFLLSFCKKLWLLPIVHGALCWCIIHERFIAAVFLVSWLNPDCGITEDKWGKLGVACLIIVGLCASLVLDISRHFSISYPRHFPNKLLQWFCRMNLTIFRLLSGLVPKLAVHLPIGTRVVENSPLTLTFLLFAFLLMMVVMVVVVTVVRVVLVVAVVVNLYQKKQHDKKQNGKKIKNKHIIG